MQISSKKILLTFARSFLTLDLARQLHACGHRIYVVDSIDYQVSRFSNAVYKNFKVPSPRFDPEQYLDSLIHIVEQENIDLLIPIFEEITFLCMGMDHFPKSCKIFAPPFELYHTLQNKWLFQCKLEELGIAHPKTHLVKDKEELSTIGFKTPFALKPSYSRASQKIIKAYPNRPLPDLEIDAHNPWVAQEWIEGNRFCTYSVCHQGEIYAHGTYPVGYAIDGNSCLLFESIHYPPIYDWVANLIREIKFTGQIAFDLIESEDKILYAIECNPRATSGLLLFGPEDRLDQALFAYNDPPILAKPGARKQIATGMILYGWRKSALQNNRFGNFLKNLFSTKDVIFSPTDLMPFLCQPLIFTGICMCSRKYGVSIPCAFTYDHDWNGEDISKISPSPYFQNLPSLKGNLGIE